MYRHEQITQKRVPEKDKPINDMRTSVPLWTVNHRESFMNN